MFSTVVNSLRLSDFAIFENGFLGLKSNMHVYLLKKDSQKKTYL